MLDHNVHHNQPVVHEYVIESHLQKENDSQSNANLYALVEMDLSFYDSLGAGFCSGSSSSGGAGAG